MPTKTLLQVVTEVAENVNSDEVTSLTNTSIEVDDIRKICLRTLEDIALRNEWEFLKDRPLQLLAGTNVIELAIPTTVQRVQTVKYRHVVAGVQSGFTTLQYMHPDDFLHRLQNNNPAEAQYDTVTLTGGAELYPANNKHPRFWTSFDEKNIVFDSYDSAENASGVEAGDSAILATIYLDFTGSNVETWVAPIPESMFQLWVQEASADASVKLRQTEDPREERKARRSYVQQIRKEPVTNKDSGSKEVDYGR
jgi:hypothetical protein